MTPETLEHDAGDGLWGWKFTQFLQREFPIPRE
jgi:hypothetical protein